MCSSKNSIQRAKSLKGYVAVLHSERDNTWGQSIIPPLALNFGPMIGHKKGWSFDWFTRATVFKTKGQASGVVRSLPRNNIYKRIRIVPLKTWAVLIPEVNAKLKVYHRPVPKSHVKPIQERVDTLIRYAIYNEKEAIKTIKMAKRFRKQAAILAKQE